MMGPSVPMPQGMAMGQGFNMNQGFDTMGKGPTNTYQENTNNLHDKKKHVNEGESSGSVHHEPAASTVKASTVLDITSEKLKKDFVYMYIGVPKRILKS